MVQDPHSLELPEDKSRVGAGGAGVMMLHIILVFIDELRGIRKSA
jgi:hypothetical protein